MTPAGLLEVLRVVLPLAECDAIHRDGCEGVGAVLSDQLLIQVIQDHAAHQRHVAVVEGHVHALRSDGPQHEDLSPFAVAIQRQLHPWPPLLGAPCGPSQRPGAVHAIYRLLKDRNGGVEDVGGVMVAHVQLGSDVVGDDRGRGRCPCRVFERFEQLGDAWGCLRVHPQVLPCNRRM
ncbi:MULTISPECIES: hypothetical protein [unclassified Xanthomonas]|uniref:hypothetical protein n=1 Tax=Xanthomonas TaxID=338 RepID=UPI0035568CEB